MSARLNLGNLGHCGSARGLCRILVCWMTLSPAAAANGMEPALVRVSEDKKGFVLNGVSFACRGLRGGGLPRGVVIGESTSIDSFGHPLVQI